MHGMHVAAGVVPHAYILMYDALVINVYLHGLTATRAVLGSRQWICLLLLYMLQTYRT